MFDAFSIINSSIRETKQQSIRLSKMPEGMHVYKKRRGWTLMRTKGGYSSPEFKS
jgi:hypothetical protein